MTAAEWTVKISEGQTEIPFGVLWHTQVVTAVIEDLRRVEERMVGMRDEDEDCGHCSRGR